MHVRTMLQALKRKPRSLICDHCDLEIDEQMMREGDFTPGEVCPLPSEMYSAVGNGCPGILRDPR